VSAPLEIASLADHPGRLDELRRLAQEAWPELMLHRPPLHWPLVFSDFAAEQLLARAPSGELLGVGLAVPLTWDGTAADLPANLDVLLDRAVALRRAGERPTALAALAVSVRRGSRDQGVSEALLQALKSSAAERGLGHLIAPVRPIWKARYPLTTIERYARWTRADGSPFDPWMRVHWQLDAEQQGILPQAFTVTGTVAQWELWTGLSFPESGRYLVDGALEPITIDWENDIGRYADPNVWMTYRLGADGRGVA
jgi:hypothetical protein